MTLAETKQVPESKSMECFTADIWSSTNAKIKQEK
jgi:hypothetical protein